MNIRDLVKLRHSCRTFSKKRIDPESRKKLEQYLVNPEKGPLGTSVSLLFHEKPLDNRMKLNRGAIRGHHSYLLASIPERRAARVDYGYVMEKAVLAVTAMNLATCWIGYFDSREFRGIPHPDHYYIPAIVIVGYPGIRPGLGERAARIITGGARRKGWERLFFTDSFQTLLSPDETGDYREALEMVRKAPSSGNTQPWKILRSSPGTFRFFKESVNRGYETKGLHDIDMGIALAHFELGARDNHLRGKWYREEKAVLPRKKDIQYVISWLNQQSG